MGASSMVVVLVGGRSCSSWLELAATTTVLFGSDGSVQMVATCFTSVVVVMVVGSCLVCLVGHKVVLAAMRRLRTGVVVKGEVSSEDEYVETARA